MKKILFFILLACLFACQNNSQLENQDNLFVVKGNISNYPNGPIVLKHKLEKSYEFADSTITDSLGNFTLRAKVDYQDFYIVQLSKTLDFVTLIGDTSKTIDLYASLENFSNNYTISGDKESENIKLLENKIDKTKQIVDSLGQIFKKEINNRNLMSIKIVLDSIYNKTINEQKGFCKKYIELNPNSLTQLICISQYIAPRCPVFDAQNDLDVYKTVLENLLNSHPNNVHVKKLQEFVERIANNIPKENQQIGQITIGKQAPDIKVKNLKGDSIALSSFRGKKILVDFWAPWSNLSKENNKNIQKLYWRFYKKDFVLFQIAIEDNKNRLLDAIKEQKLAWTCYSNLKMWECPAVLAFGVKQIPFCVLIDNNFNVYKIDPSLQEIIDYLD